MVVAEGFEKSRQDRKKQSFTKADQNNLKNTEMISKQILSLPIYPELSTSELDSIVDCIIDFL